MYFSVVDCRISGKCAARFAGLCAATQRALIIQRGSVVEAGEAKHRRHLLRTSLSNKNADEKVQGGREIRIHSYTSYRAVYAHTKFGANASHFRDAAMIPENEVILPIS